ncbi:MAG: RNA polymerase sigma factor [Clostridia bacterium]
MVLTATAPAVRKDSKIDFKELENFIYEIGKGSNEALASLYEQTKSKVYGFSLSILKNSSDAEDILQTTYINIHSSASEYQSQGKPLAWILTIAKNLCFMKIRDRQKTSDIPQEEWEKTYTEKDTAEPCDKIILETVMNSLPDTERQIIMLHAVSGFKHREIANLLNLPLSTVLSKYHRALKQLKKLIKEE